MQLKWKTVFIVFLKQLKKDVDTLKMMLRIEFMRTRFLLCCCTQMLSCVTPWTEAHQAPLSMGFSRLEYWSGLPISSPGDLPDPEIELASLESPALADRFSTTSTIWEG